ncbi:MAG: tRNA uridine-5-carboxymethylaminomethyl(34) synthesis GTPase MnmE [Chitinophagaceae bacterium]|nr:tRNA uridine-5-carboxymethylaminomethyl(34) synthesis GTPase MnmE [Chitinophagaceae bacterium]
MLGKLAGWDDTIVALATPPGIGAIGVIRVSGPESFGVVGRLFPSKDLSLQASHTLHVGFLKEGEETLDEVVVALYRGPRSYTGEDVIEVSCHGSPYVQERVMQALLRQGARLARAGEFTQRAFLKGKMDLTQAEAVADLIASNTAASARTALHTIRGGFSRALSELREQLLQFSALIELELDFSQEDVEFADRGKFYALISSAEDMTGELLRSFKLGNVIRNGVSVAIVGKPNAGKSTLLNTLLNENRAIVSEIAGTTRDTIEETLNIDGIIFRLIDTAGIRQHTTDVIESIGVGKSLEKMQQADIVVYLFDVGDMFDEVMGRRKELEGAGGAAPGVQGEGRSGAGDGVRVGADGLEEVRSGAGRAGAGDQKEVQPGADRSGAGRHKRFLWVGNKVDAIGEDSARRKFSSLPDAIFISAKEGRQVDVLKQRLVDQVLQGHTQTEGTIVTNARHYHALQQVADSLAAIHKGLDDRLPGDLLALDIRHCLHYLGEITGEITSEDRLDYIFSKFCIGK